jgi:DNA-binding beta-propeller fold protein YncE
MDTAHREPVPDERCLLDMTTRRNLLILAGSAVALAGCDAAAPPAASAPLQDVLLLRTGTGLTRIGPDGVRDFGPAAVTSHDGRFLYRSRADGLDQVDPATGAAVRSDDYGGGWQPRAISGDGRSGAFAENAVTGPVPAGRDFSPILVTSPAGPRKFRLPGVVEPDAFTADATGLFVLEWLPATAPDRYRVRLLDLTTGELHPLNTRDKKPVPAGAEEEMRGDGRQAVLSADGTMLFTLYTHQPGHAHTRDLLSGRPGNAHAFVHVLHLTDRWAYCLDLPHPFGESPPESHALAADARHLVVADLASGRVAYANPSTLSIDQIIEIPPTPSTAGASAAGESAAGAFAALVLSPDRVFLGGGDRVTVLDRATNRVAASRPVAGPLRGLGLSRDGRRLYTGGAGEVAWSDAGTGTRLGTLPVPHLTALDHVH